MKRVELTERQSRTIDQVVGELRSANRVLFITGAGMSADSGLPTYRGIGGLYNNNETVEGLTIEQCLSASVFQSRPDLTWKYLGEVEQAAREAKHNRGHEVIAAMEKLIPTVCVLTQNIDGFHKTANSSNVIEIHGTMRRLRCTACENQIECDSYEGISIPPYCEKCDAMMRPDVVLFDEMLPLEAQRQMQISLRDDFDVTFSVGTTSAFPYIAQPVIWMNQQGRATVEINPTDTFVTEYVDHKLDLPAAFCLDEIWRRLTD
jgi:NAD-dependent deacetylase